MIGTDRNYMTEDQSKPIRDAAIRLTMMPRDTNAHGTVFGGIILSYIEYSNGNALGIASQSNGSFVATGSPNKPFQYVVLTIQ